MTRVVVTGAAGRLGRIVCSMLSTDARLTVLPVQSPLGKLSGVARVDLARPESWRYYLRQSHPDVVLHLASPSGPQGRNGSDVRALNGQVLSVTAEEAQRLGIRRIVFASSAAVYGDQGRRPAREDADLHPLSPYAEAKAEAEAVLERAAGSGLSAIALRIFNVYGPGFHDSLVNRMAGASAENPVVLNGLDGFVRDYIHADDVASAVHRSLECDLPWPYLAVNVGTGVPTSNRWLLNAISPARAKHVTVETGVESVSCADTDLAGRVLGLKARPLSSVIGGH